jgi:hypothetical protein
MLFTFMVSIQALINSVNIYIFQYLNIEKNHLTFENDPEYPLFYHIWLKSKNEDDKQVNVSIESENNKTVK